MARIKPLCFALARCQKEKQMGDPIFPFVLLYYASHEGKGKGKVQVVGPIFRKENYGIVFPDKSPLRKRVNEALLKLRENGTYDQLYKTWFGGNGS